MSILFRYEEFFGSKKKMPSKKSKSVGGSEDSSTDDELEDDEAFENPVKIINFCQLIFSVLGLAVNKNLSFCFQELLIEVSLILIFFIIEAKESFYT